jgi:sugar O-acyltransferase (sialic acid O-acetyltransferase NeuD family)
MRIGIFGAGGAGIDFACSLLLACPGAEIVFIDDADRKAPYPVVRLSDMSPGDSFILGVNDGRLRAQLESRCCAAGLVPFDLHDISARVALGVTMGAGSVLCGNTLVGHSSRVGRQFQCNWYSYVGHDCDIGDFVTFAPRVNCNGNVSIGDFAYIGTGATLRNGEGGKPLRIGEGAVVGMAAVVTRDVAPHTTVVGNPARVLERSVVLPASCPSSPPRRAPGEAAGP